MTKILGISCFYHDAAASLIIDGKIIAAAQEERFTRKKHDEQFPINAINYCLREANISLKNIDIVAFYDKPFTKFERIVETHIASAPRGLKSFINVMPVWLKQKLWVEKEIEKKLPEFKGKIVYSEHHESHAASAFFPSPFEEAAVLIVDGVGEWATTSIWHGSGASLKKVEEIHFPHSLGLLYSAFTYYLGFKINSGEYKVMGLAPYGKPIYRDVIYKNLIEVKKDASFRLNLEFFDFLVGFKMTNNKFSNLFNLPPRKPESPLDQKHMDIAASLQKVTEEIMVGLAKHAREVTGSKNLCLAGGVALNCVANGKIWETKEFNKIWIQPASGDAGGSLGASYVAWHSFLNKKRVVNKEDSQYGSLLGPSYANDYISTWLDNENIPHKKLKSEEKAEVVAKILSEGNVIGYFDGRMEFGPRSLGARSILADPRNKEMQSKLNLKIKFRESFRPFAPAVLAEKTEDWFEISTESPYMLLTTDVKQNKRIENSNEGKFGIEWLKIPKSEIPAVTHVDYSARVQTVDKKQNPSFYEILNAFYKLTNCPVLVNTSFNVRGEPIVESPEDAYRCFMRTDMDYLVIGPYLIAKKDQGNIPIDDSWKKEYELD